ncbi:MAG TPA: UvrD-helicase domain-containing protein [Ignavibacteriaceae bacterium]
MEILTPHQLAALDHKKSISLTANAGSGKTVVLAKRYIEIVLGTDVSLNQIAAITFTEKAAGELYKKIAGEIETRLKSEADTKIKSKLISVRRKLVSAKISTIHSFCIDILRDFPVEANLDANFIPIDESVSNELIELSIEQELNDLLSNRSDEAVKTLVRLFGSKYKLSAEIAKLISHRKNVIGLIEDLYSKSSEEIAVHFKLSFNSLVDKIFLKQKIQFENNLEIVNEIVLKNFPANEIALNVSGILRKLMSEKDIADVLSLLRNLEDLLCTEKGFIKTKGYLGKAKELVPSSSIYFLENFFSDFGQITFGDKEELHRDLALYGKYLIEVFNSVLKRYEKIKNENGYLDFEDILLKTKNILIQDQVKTQLVKKFRFLLVDEYQDTNESQYQIFIPIVDYLRSNNLFVVGDEKQSIYRFRDAELEIFSQTRKLISETGGDDSIMTLPDSFRMSPAICLFTNILFKNLFDNPSEIFNEVEHSEIICASDDSFEGQIEFMIAESENDYSESELIAKRILKLIQENSEIIKTWNDIAVLVRKRSSFDELQKTFTRYKIPFSIIGGKGFFQRQIIYDIYNYFSFLQNFENDTSLTGILRSPFFNVSDAKIYELSLQPGRTLFEKLNNFSLKDSYLKNISNQLNENLEYSKRNELPLLLRKILNETPLLSVLAAKSDGQQELGNIDKLIRMTIDFSNEGFNSLYDFVNFLRESIEKLEDVSQASVEKENAGVNILTIHQAKGLEYPAVFLFNCNETSQRSIIKSREISINKKFGLLTKIPEKQNYFGEYKTAPIVSVCNLIEDKKDLAEIKRLLYVAVTRAKSYLFISSTLPNEKFPARSFMGLVQSGLGQDLNSNEIILEGNLSYLKRTINSFTNFTKPLQLKLPIVRKITGNEFNIPEESRERKVVDFNFKQINDSQRGEIISASRFLAYSQCPVKYNLTYKLGLTAEKFISSIDDYRKIELIASKRELNEQSALNQKSVSNYAQQSVLKGKLIHSALEKKIDKSQLRSYVTNEIEKLGKQIREIIQIDEIISELEFFYESDEFKKLKPYKNYRNEAEIYVYEKDYVLYGIIDKLIFDKNKLIVVDYKTDSFLKNQLEEKIAQYKNQLLFYLYIAGIKYSDYSECEGRLVFVKHPDSSFVVRFNDEIKSGLQTTLKKFVADERKDKFIPNHLHCPQCSFSIDRKICVLEKAELIK